MSQTILTTSEAEVEAEPSSGKAKILTVLKENPELLQDALNGVKGYCQEVVEEIEERWGEEAVPNAGAPYVATIKSNNIEELKEHAGEGTEEQGDEEYSIAELAASDAFELDFKVTDSESRCRAVIQSSEEMLRDAANCDLDYVDVKEAVMEEYGMFFKPTNSTIQSAVSQLRIDGLLPDVGDGIDESGGVQKIQYICDLCEYKNPSYERVRDHISNKDDPAHHERNGWEGHLISIEGEEIEESQEVFDSEEVEAECDDGFDIIWSVYQNPEARQKDIASMLGISPSKLSKRMDALGIEWETRQEDVQEMVDSWMTTEDETISTERGNAGYSGPEKGADTTSGRPTQSITERPELDQEISLNITKQQAKEFLFDEDISTVKRLVYQELKALEAE